VVDTETPASSETERVRRILDNEAPRYDRQMGFFERILFAGGREWACSRVVGDVLELGFGTGRNPPYYPSDVRLMGIELSPEMLAIGRTRADELGRDVDLRIGDAQALELEDESFDAVIITFGLCTIPDDRCAASDPQGLAPRWALGAARARPKPLPSRARGAKGARSAQRALRGRSSGARSPRLSGVCRLRDRERGTAEVGDR
jgi:SAM-dependent methyltransferase